jgi:hypothetical protein
MKEICDSSGGCRMKEIIVAVNYRNDTRNIKASNLDDLRPTKMRFRSWSSWVFRYNAKKWERKCVVFQNIQRKVWTCECPMINVKINVRACDIALGLETCQKR